MLERAPLAIGLVCLVLAIVAASRRNAKQHRYPPGPPGLPILGNLLDAPKEYSWFTFARWGREYNSNIVSFTVLGRRLVVLNKYKDAKEIFEERSRIYSDRTSAVMATELVGWHRNFGLTPYGELWRLRRRMFHQHFKPQVLPAYHGKLMKGARSLTQMLLESPDGFLKHFRRVPGTTVLDVVYAMDLDPRDNATMEPIEKAVKTFADLADAGAFLVDLIPILKYLPSWLPGVGFKRQGAVWGRWVSRMHEDPYQEVKSDVMSGKSRPCVASDLIREFEDRLNDNSVEDSTVEEDIICVTGTAYTGSDTTTFALANFVLAMLLFPEVQQRAQEELDRVVGRDRLPDIADQDSLPYTASIVKELLRWRPIGPVAVPHRSTADDWYEGYFIPEGSLVIGNVWAILHDEERYPDPEAFKPERFLTAEGTLDPSVPDPSQAFGFGRRICPGRYFAQIALFLYISHMLAAFSIEKPVDEMGNVVEPTRECEARKFWHPKPFKVKFKPRLEGLESMTRTPGS
ncbi:cytochrome P450 [Phanerochaete sordida]|uniref:Cytochrome P450 n=1 Tax=Phanerochaete sordida TaxID=48140 RepID=A0A9P3GLJ2_9APHY|nr:cytochrome P450 [Phanerochaete sordida]